MATTAPPCDHTAGFKDLHAIEPQPGEPPQLLKGTCLGCGETRYFDRSAAIYRTPSDAYNGTNPERIRSLS